MYVVNKKEGEISSLPAKEVELKQIKAAGSLLAQRILGFLCRKSSYPMEIAKELKENEQKVYYHIRKLEKAGLIEVIKKEAVQGAMANFYGLVEPAFVLRFNEFQETHTIEEEQPREFLEPFIENGRMDALIVVGSPDPHGPEKARSRDGYYGVDLALFFGSFLNYVDDLKVRLDTEVREEELKGNLILIGGPVVNTITGKINNKFPIRFDENFSIFSSISKKKYHNDEVGIIVKIKNPFNDKKKVLLVAGKRYSGTRAVIIAFLKHFKEIFKGNLIDNRVFAKVVEGVDLNSDGIVDDIEILE